MDPSQYTGKEWTDLLREMSPRQIRNAVKRAYRAVSKEAVKIAQRSLAASGLQSHGADLKKGIRPYVYSRGGGFLVTVKARAANRQGKGETGMHANRFGFKKPVLMWAEEGTKQRRTKTKTKWFTRSRKGHPTGSMPAYGFLAKAQPEMFSVVERGLTPEVEKAVDKIAKKCGFV